MAGKKEAGADDIMSPAQMKGILANARRGEPVSCAVALTKDKDGVVLLDKRRKPKQLLAELRKGAEKAGLALDAATLRFGRASVDAEADAGLVTLAVNKEAPSAMRPKLLAQLKRAGFAKVEFSTDAALEDEADDAPAGASAGAAASAGTAVQDAGGAAADGGGALPQAALAAAAKARDLWAATRRNVEAQVDALHKELAVAYKDHEFGTQVDGFVQEHVHGILDELHDPRLEQVLAAVGTAAAEDGKRLLQEAAGIVGRHQAHVAGDPLIAELDQAPFGSPTIHKTLTASLAAMQSTIGATVAGLK